VSFGLLACRRMRLSLDDPSRAGRGRKESKMAGKRGSSSAGGKRGRSASTGKFVKQSTVKRHPNTTVNERTEKKGKGKGGK